MDMDIDCPKSAGETKISGKLINLDMNMAASQLFDADDDDEPVVASSNYTTHLTTSVRVLLTMEINNYNNFPKLDRDKDPFDWWKRHSILLPLMSKLAARCLSSPPSSVESERTFSIGGNIVTKNRNRLRADNTEKLIFLNSNLPLLPIQDYSKY